MCCGFQNDKMFVVDKKTISTLYFPAINKTERGRPPTADSEYNG